MDKTTTSDEIPSPFQMKILQVLSGIAQHQQKIGLQSMQKTNYMWRWRAKRHQKFTHQKFKQSSFILSIYRFGAYRLRDLLGYK